MKFDLTKGYCCSLMHAVVTKKTGSNDWRHAIPIEYSAATRECILRECSPLEHRGLPLAKNELRPGWILEYCPYCGAKLHYLLQKGPRC